MILIHSTHEAGVKVGGIGAVLDGLLNAPSYLEHVARTLLVGPMNTQDSTEMERLLSARNRLFIYYFADQGYMNCPQPLAELLSGIERAFGVRILYGRRGFGAAGSASSAEHEVVLVDASEINGQRLDGFRYFIWQQFGLDCARYQHEPEFIQHIATAEPALAALHSVLGFKPDAAGWTTVEPDDEPATASATLLCHEFMGLPLWYAAALNYPGQYRSAFVAHEVATVRLLVEDNDGHDTRFYNIMRSAAQRGQFLEDVFGDQSYFYKHAMLKTAERCDFVFAVGDLVVEELRFLSPGFKNKRIDLTYNGAPSQLTALEDVRSSNNKLKQYAEILTGLNPTFVFSHATRMVVSKGLWRDIRVMEQVDGQLAARGESAVLFIVSSVKPLGRSSSEAEWMNREYGWPAQHRYGWPDLVDYEASLYDAIALFNSQARASRIVLVNQFGFSRDRLGETMPADLGFGDLRRGTDLEFGQSIYEPFGIAQIEALPAGALCVVSDVCGCVGFVRQSIGMLRLSLPVEERQRPIANVIVGQYTHLQDLSVDPIQIGRVLRDDVERNVARVIAQLVVEHLPRTDQEKQQLIAQGYALAQRMSWDMVASEQLLPSLLRTA